MPTYGVDSVPLSSQQTLCEFVFALLACNCDLTGSENGVCDIHTGQCPCKPGVATASDAPGPTGLRCTQCVEKKFGFDSGNGCEECKCNNNSSTSPECSADGKCNCLVGVTGARCEQCIAPHHQLSDSRCVPCNCDPMGSENLDCDNTGKCTCKRNTVGMKCSTCEDFAFNKNADNPHGCQSCFCFGHSTQCGPARGFVESQISSDFSSDVDGWRGVDGSGIEIELDYRKGKRALRIIADGTQDVFFVLPEKFLGDIRMSYMMTMSFQLRFTSDEQFSRPQGQDVIIESPITTVYASLDKLPTSNMQTFEIRLDESTFSSVDSAVRELDMIEVLSSVVSIKIRASYVPGDSSSLLLYGFAMQTAVQGTNGTEAMNVEECVCPVGHTGVSCELCMPGFKRERPSLGHRSKCIPCECNEHSSTCDQETGTCSGCMHNTQGDQCDECTVGFYGDATQGSPDDCQPCPCPDPSGPRKFGSACEVTPSNAVVCTSCFPGHTGPNCEICMDGYFGDPLGARGNVSGCSDCSCNGNIDLQVTGNCDSETGECLKCIGNTGGRFCQICKEGYFGDAVIAKNCQRGCNCFVYIF